MSLRPPLLAARDILAAALLLLLPALASAAQPGVPARAEETLQQSIQRRQAFPFTPNCSGNTQEMAAYLWQQRNQTDQRLLPLLGGAPPLERWRSERRAVCERSAQRAAGGSLLPVLWLQCENNLNEALLQQFTPLGR
ncbi:MAG: hypothetical protein ACKO5F_00395 [Synechococcus sp.]